jgi:DNA-directed RNA polymerase subunit delta
MGHFTKQTEVDLAYQVLQENHQAMYFRDLINKVLTMQKEDGHAAQSMAEVHTQINMDSRFVHMGKGMWGLNEWLPRHRTAHYAVEEIAAAEENE